MKREINQQKKKYLSFWRNFGNNIKEALLQSTFYKVLRVLLSLPHNIILKM
jgi:HSP90 family molecular chaperone